MYDGPHSLCFSSIRKKITFNENALLRDQCKKHGSFWKINTTALILKIFFLSNFLFSIYRLQYQYRFDIILKGIYTLIHIYNF